MKKLILLLISIWLALMPMGVASLGVPIVHASANFEDQNSANYINDFRDSVDEIAATIVDTRYLTGPAVKPNGVIGMDGYDAYMLTSDDGYFGLMKQYEQGATSEPAAFNDLPTYDLKTIRSLLNMVTPKSVGGEGEEWINVKTMINGYNSDQKSLSKENQPADTGEVRGRSQHAFDQGKAIDVSEADYIKCTQVYIDENTDTKIVREKSKAIAPIPISFRYQDSANIDGLGDPTNNGNGTGGKGNGMDNVLNNTLNNLTNGSQTFNGAIGQMPATAITQAVNQAMSQKLGIQTGNNVYPDYHGGLAYNASQIMSQAINTESGLPAGTKPGYDFASTVKNMGAASAAGIFNNYIAPEAFKGSNLSEFQENIGREELAKRMYLPAGSIKGTTSDEIVTNIGKAYIGTISGVDSGLIDKNTSDNDSFKKSLGQSIMEKYLNLAPNSLATDNWGEARSKAGAENFDSRFSADEIKISAGMLGISANDLTGYVDSNNLANLKHFIGSKSVENNYGFYQDKTIMAADGTQVTVNTRNEAMNLVDYPKPYYAYAGQTQPDWIEGYVKDNNYDWKADKAHIITTRYINSIPDYAIYEFEANDNSGTYEKLLAESAKDSITKKILAGEINDDLFRRVGRQVIAENLGSTDQEKYGIRGFIRTGEIPVDENGHGIVDTQSEGAKIGLKDSYDLARVFTGNRSHEVFQRLGRTTLENAVNPQTAEYIKDNHIKQDPFSDNIKAYYNQKLDQLSQTLGTSAPDAKTYVQRIKDELNSTLNDRDSQISILKRSMQNDRISGYLFKIGDIVKSSSLSASGKDNTITIVNEIINQQDFKDLTKDIKLGSGLDVGVTQQEVINLLKYPNQTNINQFVTDTGLRAMSNAISSSDIEDPHVKDALSYALRYGPGATNYPVNYVSEIARRLDSPELTKAAKILNFSMNFPKDTFTGGNLANIFSGGQKETIKQALHLFSDLFSTHENNVQGLFEGDTSKANTFNFDKFMDGLSGLTTSAQQLQNIFAASASNNFADRMMQGINMLPNLLGYYQMMTGDQQDNADFNKMLGLMNQYWRDGNQVVNVISDMKKMFGQNGFNLGDAISYSGSLINSLKENSILKLFGGIKADFGLTDDELNSKLPDWLKNARLANLLTAPNNKTIGDWVNTVKNTFQFTFDGEEDRQLFNFGAEIISQGANRDTIFSTMDYYLHKKDPNIPLGMTKNVLSGDTKGMLNSSGQFIQSWANDPKNKVDPEIARQISPVFNAVTTNNWNGVTDAAKSYAKDWLNKPENWSKFFGDTPDYLKSPVIDLMTTGNFQNFANNIGNNWEQYAQAAFGKSLDKMFGDVGATQALSNQFWQNPFKSTFPDAFAGAKGIDKFLGSAAEGAFNTIIVQVTSMLTSYLDPVFAGLEEQLGLPSGTFSGALATILPVFFMPHYALGVALLSYFMPILFNKLGLGSFGRIFGSSTGQSKPKAEVWCAMDYYPVLDVGKNEEAPKYDIAFYSSPPATPYAYDSVAKDADGLNKLTNAVGDGSGGAWKTIAQGKDHPGEFKIDNNKKNDNNKNVLMQKFSEAARFKIKQLVGELLRINQVSKMNDWYELPMQIKTYKEGAYNTHYTNDLNRLYGLVSREDGTDKIIIEQSMADYMETGVRRGVFSEKYHIDNVHWGY